VIGVEQAFPNRIAGVIRTDDGDAAYRACRAAIEGGLVTALCGAKFQPVRDPTRFPVCRPCARLLDQLDNRSFS